MSKKITYREALNEAYMLATNSGLEEGAKYLNRFKWDQGIKNVITATLIKKYTRIPALAVNLSGKMVGIEYKEAKWAAVIGGELATRDGDCLEALIIILGTRLNTMSFNATYKFLRVLRQGPIESLTPDSISGIDVGNLEPKQVISKVYGNKYLECPYCGKKKPQSQFETGSKYCKKCRESFKGEVKRDRLIGKELSVAVISSEKTKKHIEKESK